MSLDSRDTLILWCAEEMKATVYRVPIVPEEMEVPLALRVSVDLVSPTKWEGIIMLLLKAEEGCMSVLYLYKSAFFWTK